MGVTVTISGSGLAGATSVKFNGRSATIISRSGTAVRTRVPPQATSGPITVVVSGYRSDTSDASFTVTGGRPSATLTLAPGRTAPGLHVKAIVRPSSQALSVSARLVGAAPPLDAWVTLKASPRTETWIGALTAPTTAGMYPIQLQILFQGESQRITFAPRPTWLLKDAPPEFFGRSGFRTPEDAARSAPRLLPGLNARVVGVRARPLLDQRVPELNKLYEVTLSLPKGTPVLPPGEHTFFAYVLRDGASGHWRLLEVGTGP